MTGAAPFRPERAMRLRIHVDDVGSHGPAEKRGHSTGTFAQGPVRQG